MRADATEVAHLKQIPIDYVTPNGLKINFQKSSLVPINIDLKAKNAEELAKIMGYAVASMSFTLPMGTTKLLLPLVDRTERKVTSTMLLIIVPCRKDRLSECHSDIYCHVHHVY
jgi:hypothetical protein